VSAEAAIIESEKRKLDGGSINGPSSCSSAKTALATARGNELRAQTDFEQGDC